MSIYPSQDDLRRHKVVPHDQWLAARQELLVKEKELTRQRDKVAALRRDLPWERVEKLYEFDTPKGSQTLGDLFRGRSQLFVYHFMLAPNHDHLCEGCCFISDHVDAARQHFEHNDLVFVAISRAAVSEIEAVKQRMGWKFPWVSSGRSSFNYDYGVSFTPEQIASGPLTYNYGTTDYKGEDLHGISIFYQNEAGEIFHTYSTYGRGGDIFLGAYHFLDVAPKGRNEKDTMDWVKRHDEYENAEASASCCH